MAKRTHIIANAFECMAIILIAMRDMNIIVTSGDPKFRDDAAMIEQIVNLCQQTLDGVMDKSAAEALKRLWANEKVLETYDRRSEYHLPDCAK